MTRLHRIEALAGSGRYAVTFQRPDTSEHTAVVQLADGTVTVADASLPTGWTRDGAAFAEMAEAVQAMERARSLGPAAAALVDIDGGWDVMMGNVVLGDRGVPTCTAHGPMQAIDAGAYECSECGARAGLAA